MKVKKAGCILIDLQNKKIGLVHRTKKGDYTFPKGHLEKGETLQECAIRETKEETGRNCYMILEEEIRVLNYLTPSGEDVENYMYLVADDGIYNGKIAKQDKEILVWKSLDEVEDTLSYEDLKEMWREIKCKVQHILENKNL